MALVILCVFATFVWMKFYVGNKTFIVSSYINLIIFISGFSYTLVKNVKPFNTFVCSALSFN